MSRATKELRQARLVGYLVDVGYYPVSSKDREIARRAVDIAQYEVSAEIDGWSAGPTRIAQALARAAAGVAAEAPTGTGVCCVGAPLHDDRHLGLCWTIGVVVLGHYSIGAVRTADDHRTVEVKPGTVFALQHRLPHCAVRLSGRDPFAMVEATVARRDQAEKIISRLMGPQEENK